MTTIRAAIADPLRATDADLPPAVVRAMESAVPDLSSARRRTVESGGIPWASAEWGDPSAPPLLLAHGVASNAATFWRVGPAIAAAGRHVIAVDMPGHGRTGTWQGRHRFRETAADLVAWVAAAALDRPGLAVLGHSWGAMVVAGLPAAGLRPDRLILLDPPVLPVTAMEAMTHDPIERPYASLSESLAAIGSANPGWSDGDIEVKALALTQFEVDAVLGVLTRNGNWDGGLGALADPAAGGIPVWLIRGEFARGGLIPEAAVQAFAARFGADHVITIADAPHSPQRLFPEATVLAILRALAP